MIYTFDVLELEVLLLDFAIAEIKRIGPMIDFVLS